MALNRVPAATYRIQLHQEFRFADAAGIVNYLDMLGITDIYASPILTAQPGSTHGYDVIDPTTISQERGGEDGFTELSNALNHRSMGLLLDIVPNHMAASPSNSWWIDVLRHGQRSAYAHFFDIHWDAPRETMRGRVLLPVLGEHYTGVLEQGQLTLELDEDGLWLRYFDWRLPVRPGSYHSILNADDHDALTISDEARRILDRLDSEFRLLDSDPSGYPDAVEHLWTEYHQHPEVAGVIDHNLQAMHGTPGDPASFNALDHLVSQQHYRLAFWRVAGQEINYRRFFDINDLVSLRVEDEDVFTAIHWKVADLARAGSVTGLRIDHIDGLYDPDQYLTRLQRLLTGSDNMQSRFYVAVEKILVGDEQLPHEWWAAGTTGYDFLNKVNGLLADRRSARALDQIYSRVTGDDADFPSVVYQQKHRVITDLFAGDLRRLAVMLGEISERDRYGCDLTLDELERSIAEITAWFPVYRTYIDDEHVSMTDRVMINQAVETAVGRRPELSAPLAFTRRVLLLNYGEDAPESTRASWLAFVMRWQQFTGPVMAKGFEDTSLYIYTWLISMNAVGGEPDSIEVSVDDFHNWIRQRGQHWPHTMNATSTHDHKRSEDVNARINVLSEMPTEWAERLNEWRSWNGEKKWHVDGYAVPDGNAELLLYQTMIGAWPLSEDEVEDFIARLKDYMIKAAREAKVHTSWINQNPEYERALLTFIDAILEESDDNPFPDDFRSFQRRIAFYGALNSLSQTLLKMTSPGLPDFYQGTELWDFSLVDPDNRRPVDYDRRMQALEMLQKREQGDLLNLSSELLSDWEDGRIKLFLTYRTLNFRREYRSLFESGEYLPLVVQGEDQRHVIAFARHDDNGNWAIVVVSRLLSRLAATANLDPGDFPLGEPAWRDTAILLPESAPTSWSDLLSGERRQATSTPDGPAIPLADLFRHIPIAVLSA